MVFTNRVRRVRKCGFRNFVFGKNSMGSAHIADPILCVGVQVCLLFALLRACIKRYWVFRILLEDA